ncbi:MAG: hypothetical protein ACKVQS_10145 [Fimbriimonadaceae bacterium]
MNKIFITSLMASCLVVSAHAVTLHINGMASGLYETVTINHNAQNVTVYAGAQSVSVDGGSAINLYCIDLDHSNQAGYNYNANIVGAGSVANSAMIANLFSHAWTTINDSTEAAAFQIALWDIITDGADGISTGNFKVTSASSAITTQTATYLALTTGAGPESLNLDVYEATEHGTNGNLYQNLIGANPVPEPMSIFVIGTIAAAAIRRKRN